MTIIAKKPVVLKPLTKITAEIAAAQKPSTLVSLLILDNAVFKR